MATTSSNFPTIRALLDQFANLIDLTHDNLGADLLDTAAEGMYDRSISGQRAPDGTSWAANKEPYASSARKGGQPIGVLSFDMLDLQQLRGEREITATTASMTYGTTETARDKLAWFTYGKPGTQEPREVYGLDQSIEDDMTDVLKSYIEDRLNELEQGG